MALATHIPILPGYQISSQLYAGSRTNVYRASRNSDQLPVIIKLLAAEYPSFQELLQFRHQYTISKNLPIPGIIQPLSLETYGNGYILVLPDLGEISLTQYIKTTDLSIADFLHIALQLTDIISNLHQHRVIHKDIKPANIIIHPETKQVKIIDFSIASLLPKETPEIKNPHVLEGTLAYMSPEQTGRMNRGIDYRSDYYALGVTFYELLTGTLPFICDDPMELVHCHLAKHPEPLKVQNFPLKDAEAIPQVISDIVMKLLAKNAEDRYQSAVGLKSDLELCLSQLHDTGKITNFVIAQRDVCVDAKRLVVRHRFLIPEKLYGREQEVRTLLQAFERAANGTSEMMLVAGFSGIGKTAVVNEVHKLITRQQGYFIQGKFDQFHRNIPLSGFLQALRGFMGQLLSESDAQLSEWQTQILAAVGDNGQVLIDVIPELEKVIGKQPPAAEISGNAAQNRFNLLLQNFIAVFTTKAHPLVMFLDDLQWADAASLQLMQLLMTDRNYLLLLGAYRNNEVSPVHPLMITVEALQQADQTINTLTLKPLTWGDTHQLVADTLHDDGEAARSLTEFIFRKTQGNPFFITQFLKALHEDDQITFNATQGYWQCNIRDIDSLNITDNVVELIAQQLQKLPAETQTVLKLAACIGNCFDLSILAIVSEQSPAQTTTALWPALQEGLILPQSELYKFYLDHESAAHTDHIENVSYRFLHDRIQQAAYSLIPIEQKQQTHHQVGELLLRHTTNIELEDKIFDIVNQLNYSVELITQPQPRQELAQLNLLAGKRAKLVIAYDAAYTYFLQGINLLTAECWQNQYTLALDLYVGAAESAYLKTDFATMKTLCDHILTVVTEIQDQIKVYELLIFYHHTQSQFREAVALAVQTLEYLGETFPSDPDTPDFLQALKTTSKLIHQVGFENLAQLPPMQNPQQLAVMKILCWACFPAYFAVPEMLGLLVCRLVDVTLKYGHSPLTPFAFGIFSVLMNAGVGDIETGKQFGELAIALEKQQSDPEYRALTSNVIYGLSRHFYKPVRDCLQPLIAGYQSFAQNGDAQSSAYCLINAYFCTILSGQNLNDIRDEYEKYIQQVIGFKQEQVVHQLHIWMQVVHNLTVSVENPALLQGEYFDIAIKLPELYQTRNFNTINYAHTAQAILAYLLGDYKLSVAHAATTEPHLGASTGKFFIAAHNFYHSLSLTALYPYSPANVQSEYLEKLQNNQQKMQIWATHCPENFLHRWLLVESEINRLKHNFCTAIELYDRAIATAKDNGYLQEEALANELAAKFYLDWGKEQVATGYMQSAYYCYARWGAKSKTDDLETRYPDLLRPILQQISQNWSPLETLATLATPHISFHTSKKSTHVVSNSLNKSLDFATILKASQSLSSTIHLEELLRQLTQIILQNSGGDGCVLILPDSDGNWYLQAIATPETTELYSQPLEGNHNVPVKLIQYVKNTQEVVVIDHLKTDLPVIDEYLTQHQPQSVLCLPILHQGHLIGILYLQNRATSGVFGSDRILILDFLCTQAAISLENARLYQQIANYSQNLEAEVAQKTHALNQKAQDLEETLQHLQRTHAQLIHTEKMSSLGQLVAGIAHEINNPISFIKGNLKYLENYIGDLMSLLFLYQEVYTNPDAKIQAKRNAIDIDFLCQDVINILQSMQVGSDRISQIVLSLRNFSRLDEAPIKAVDLHSGIESTLLILQNRLQADEQHSEIQVIKDYGHLPTVTCYPGQLNQVFLHILNNAIDAIREHGENLEQPTIRIHTEVMENEYIKIAIANTSSFIPTHIQERIFEPFFTTKGVGRGTGLGLFVSYSIVKKHGGNITVNSLPLQGTEFVISIPIISLF